VPLSGWLFDDEFAEQLVFEAELEERQETLQARTRRRVEEFVVLAVT